MTDFSSRSATPRHAGVKLVCQRCRLLRDHDGPQGPLMTSRVLPAAAISNLALLDGGPAKIHELLRGRADYAAQQVTDAIRQYEMLSDEAQRQAARSCRRIQDDGFTGCPPNGCLLPDGRRAEFPFELASWWCDPAVWLQACIAECQKGAQ